MSAEVLDQKYESHTTLVNYLRLLAASGDSVRGRDTTHNELNDILTISPQDQRTVVPELSIIIPTLKRRSEVECLEALDRDPFSEYEVLLQSEDRATTARNAGIRRASADKLVFLDDDSMPRTGYLSRVSSVLDGEAVVAGRTVHPGSDIFSKHFTDHYDFGDQSRYVTRFWGCNMAARRSVFEEVGMWDEGIPWGHEEVELAERVLTAYPIYYDPSLVVEHAYADSIADYWRKMYRIERQKPYLWNKQGVPRAKQWSKIIGQTLTPTNYIGWSLRHVITRGGGNICKTLGQVRGMWSTEREDVPNNASD